jgi:hypothetical protein
MQFKIEGGNKGRKHQALLANMAAEKHLGGIAVAAKFETVTALTTSGARSLAPRYQFSFQPMFRR